MPLDVPAACILDGRLSTSAPFADARMAATSPTLRLVLAQLGWHVRLPVGDLLRTLVCRSTDEVLTLTTCDGWDDDARFGESGRWHNNSRIRQRSRQRAKKEWHAEPEVPSSPEYEYPQAPGLMTRVTLYEVRDYDNRAVIAVGYGAAEPDALLDLWVTLLDSETSQEMVEHVATAFATWTGRPPEAAGHDREA